MKQQQGFARALMAAVLVTAGTAIAGPAPVLETGKGPVEPPKEKDWCEDLWSYATLYKNKDHPVIQEFAIIGRYQGQYWMLDSDKGDDDEWDHRRFRYGFKAKLFHDFELKAEASGDLNVDDWYSGLTEVHLTWKPNDAVNVVIGKQKAKFSLDWSTPSREILTIE